MSKHQQVLAIRIANIPEPEFERQPRCIRACIPPMDWGVALRMATSDHGTIALDQRSAAKAKAAIVME